MKLITVVFFTMLLNIQNGFAAFRCLDNFKNILAGKDRSEFKIVRHHDRFWNYRKYENGEKFVANKNDLLQKIDFWAQVGERDIRLRELRIKQARSLVVESIKLDRPEITFITLRPLFTRIQIAFFKMQRNNLIFENLMKARNLLLEGKKDQAITIITEVINKQRFKHKFPTNSSPNRIIDSIDLALTKIENENTDITIQFAKRYAEYTSTIDSLLEMSKKSGNLGEKAKEVLELLKPNNLISEQLDYFSQFESIGHITKEMMREVVVGNRISEIIYLKRELMMEKWTSILSRMSATQIYELTDFIIKRFPWLNTPSVRSHIRYTVDNKEILTHYPNIDRMVADGNSPKVMWEYLLSLDARDRTTDSLIRTFARRIDTREEWRQVKMYGKMRAEKLKEAGHEFDLEVRLYDKMIEMEQAVMSLPPLAPWHRSGGTKFARFIIDGLVLGAFVYGSYYFMDDLISDEESTEDLKELEGLEKTSEMAFPESSNEEIGESIRNSLPIKPLEFEGVIEKEASEFCGEYGTCPTK